MIEEEPKVRVCGVDGGPDVGVEFIDALAECLGARVDGSETREIVDEAVNSRSPSILQCRTPPLARRHVKQGGLEKSLRSSASSSPASERDVAPKGGTCRSILVDDLDHRTARQTSYHTASTFEISRSRSFSRTFDEKKRPTPLVRGAGRVFGDRSARPNPEAVG